MKINSAKNTNFFWKGKKVLVTGGAGFLGKHLVEKLTKLRPDKIFIPRSKDFDLRFRETCRQVVKDIDIVIHLAGNVGGIGYNMLNPGTLYYDNIIMGTHLMEEARQANVKKFVAVGTVCAYPKYAKVPFKEEQLWDGYPEETNAPYGLAKKMLLVQSQAYRKQYGFNGIHLIPVNLYGPFDNFDFQSSHVIPALIQKIHGARINQLPQVEVWGTGKATREFLFVEDAARGILLASEKYDKPEPINLGAGFEISIRKLAGLIADMLEFKGEIKFDTANPDGQPRRLIDTTKAKKEFGFIAKTSFQKGLRQTISWYLKSYENWKKN